MNNLPIEILIKICCQLDFKEFINLSSTNSIYYSSLLFDDEIWRQILSSNPKFIYKTFSSSARVDVTSTSSSNLTLTELIKCQYSLSSIFKTISSHQQLAKLLTQINNNWSNSNYTTRVINFNNIAWRFKLDSINNLIISSQLQGGYSIHDIDGNLLERHRLGTAFPHIELSEGHLYVSAPGIDVTIYRHSTITSPPSPLPPARDPRQVYLPYMMCSLAGSFNITKLRFPYFCAVDASTGIAAIWDLTDPSKSSSKLSFSIQSILRQDVSVTYLDFDHYLYIVTSKRITIWSMETGLLLKLLETACVGEVEDIRWGALHYDPRGTALIAFKKHELLWRPRYKEGEDPIKVAQQSVVLLLPGLRLNQLCVENGRACFTTTASQTGRQHLWLLILDEFENLDSFKLNPPRLTCLSKKIPSSSSIQRIEMTSDELFVPIQFGPHDADRLDDEPTSKDPIELAARWFDTAGNRLTSLRDENYSDRMMQLGGHDGSDEWPVEEGFNALMVFSFTP